MSDDNETETITPAKRGRPTGSKTQRARRNFARELADLQVVVQTACDLLRRANATSNPEVSKELIAVALETLEGET